MPEVNSEKHIKVTKWQYWGGVGGLMLHLLILLSMFIVLYHLNHIHIWRMSLQLSCSDTCQICMWCSALNQSFWKTGEVAEQ